MKFNVKYFASLEGIFSDLSLPFTKGNLGPTSALAADIVGIGDSWLKFAINKAIIEPIRDVEDQEWFKTLDEKWKVTIYFVFLLFRTCVSGLVLFFFYNKNHLFSGVQLDFDVSAYISMHA